MNKYLIRIWVEESLHNLRTVWVEAESFSQVQGMSQEDFAESIYEFEDVIDQDYGTLAVDVWDMENLELDEEHIDNITPPDEAPDGEDKDPNAGRGK